jgi:hypothetical protein
VKKQFNVISVILIALLSIRFISQVVIGVLSIENLLFLSVVAVFAIAYLLALIGVILKQKWGSILAIIIAIIDLISAFTIIGESLVFWAAIMDVILLFLAYKEYKQVMPSLPSKS